MFTSRGAEFFWSHKFDAFERWVDLAAPQPLKLDEVMRLASVARPNSREGIGWKTDVIGNPMVQIVTNEFSFWKACMELETVAKESSARVEQELQRVKQVVMSFRETTKNDLSSLKAASDRVQTETLKMSKHYKEAVDVLTNPQFMQAIENAERLASALTAIQNLNQTKLSFAVFGQPQASQS
jgi:hypothetical protein